MTDMPTYPPPPPPPMQPVYVQMPKPRKTLLRILVALLAVALALSVIINLSLLVVLAGAAADSALDTVTMRKGKTDQQVAVYHVVDMIDGKQAAQFEAFAQQVANDTKVKAVVIRVDSPGGGVAESNQIHENMLKLKAAGKTLVISMGGVAASGGYYISANADHIYAEPTTVTGSIGVISVFPVLKGMMDKIGVDWHIIRSTKAERHKARLNPFESPSEEAKARRKALLDKIQGIFMAVVAKGRGSLTQQDVAKLADGRVWLGDEAVKNKLVDKIGYLGDAIDWGARTAGLGTPHVVRYSRRQTLGEKLFEGRHQGLQIDSDLLDKLQTPRMMLLRRPDLGDVGE